MTDTNDAAINRIYKLMALTTDRGASEAEAALAAEHVQRLLAEHNLSMAAVEATGAATTAGGKRVREQGVGSRQVYKWQRTLMAAVAELNYCKSFERFQARGLGRVFDGYDLIGRVDNVTTTRQMFEYLLQTIERLARDDVNNDPTQFFTRYAHSFKEGCADRIVLRLQLKQAEIVAEQEAKVKADAARARHPGSAPSTAMVVLRDFVRDEDEFNNDLVHGWAPGTTAAQRRKREEADRRYRADYDAKNKRRDELVAQGISPGVAWNMAHLGMDRERAERIESNSKDDKPTRPETDSQRRRRERSDEAWRERMWRQQQREADRLDRGAYHKGQNAGDGVGLDRQVDSGKRGRLT